MSSNPALDLAFGYVAHTSRNLFLTGKAGTGKTTFLHRVKKEVHKRMVVVAPTGVAAINAGAQTIHSQFSLPFGFIEPGRDVHRARQLSKKKAELLQNIDLLIIDEISMVRADVLDTIDFVLRKLRRSDEAFGGVQLLMIGDLHQLPPVVVREEEREVYHHYRTPYFFGAKVMPRARVITIPLTKIYRQSDAAFIELLNKVRHNEIDDSVIHQLNGRYRAQPDDGTGQITLTSHNAAARKINGLRLSKLTTPAHNFTAEISGAFPKSMYPNDLELSFKVGAQVMFNKNDTGGSLYYNGKIGEITAIEEDAITVVCPGEPPLTIEPVTWDNTKTVIDELSGKPKEEIAGSYTQHPLRLAWAITIHKSQGLTFDKVIIDAADSFSHGQVYVALSRCRTLEGITLRSKIQARSVKTDTVVTEHSKAAERNRPTVKDLAEDRRQFQITCLEHLFDFTRIDYEVNAINKSLALAQLQGDGADRFFALRDGIRDKLIAIGRGFQPQIRAYRTDAITPETDEAVLIRLQAAAAYYLSHFTGDIGRRVAAFDFLCDNAGHREAVQAKLKDLHKSFHVKKRLMETVAEGFSAEAYTRTQTVAAAEFNNATKTNLSLPKPRTTAVPSNVEHPDLFRELSAWRFQKATDLDVPPYRVFSNKTLINICQVLPVTPAGLLRVHGVGKKTENLFGEAVTNIVKRYTIKKKIPGDLLGSSSLKVSSATTFSQTLDFFRQGLTAREIARRRGLKEETVFIHAIKYLREGALTPDAILGAKRRTEVDTYTQGKGLMDISVLHHQAEGRFSLGELRVVLTGRTLVGAVG